MSCNIYNTVPVGWSSYDLRALLIDFLDAVTDWEMEDFEAFRRNQTALYHTFPPIFTIDLL